MTRPYSPYASSRKPAYRRNVADADSGTAETSVIEDYDSYDPYADDRCQDQYADHFDADHDVDEYDDDDYYEPIDRRWIWVGGVAAAVLLVAVICTVVILGGGDSGSVSATINPPAVTTSQVASTTTPAPPRPPAPLPTAAGPLSPETVTSVSPVPTAAATPTETVAAPDPRTITYQITGSRQMLDLITVIYTDQQGALQTDVNVALPWSKTVVLDPGVQLTSVTATSLLGKLNCSITDASGAMISAQTNNSMIATCTK